MRSLIVVAVIAAADVSAHAAATMKRAASGVPRIAFLALVLLPLAGCGVVGPFACTDELTWQVSTAEATVRVGEGVTLSAEAFTCGGAKELPVDIQWSTSDTDVVSVGAGTGRVTGVAEGEAEVVGEDSGPYGIGPLGVAIRVVNQED